MRYLVWVLRALVFLLVLLFALKNTDPVNVRFYADHGIADVPLIYIRQMAHYRRAMQEMHPDKAVKCALLWTEGPHLMVLPADRM